MRKRCERYDKLVGYFGVRGYPWLFVGVAIFSVAILSFPWLFCGYPWLSVAIRGYFSWLFRGYPWLFSVAIYASKVDGNGCGVAGRGLRRLHVLSS